MAKRTDSTLLQKKDGLEISEVRRQDKVVYTWTYEVRELAEVNQHLQTALFLAKSGGRFPLSNLEIHQASQSYRAIWVLPRPIQELILRPAKEYNVELEQQLWQGYRSTNSIEVYEGKLNGQSVTVKRYRLVYGFYVLREIVQEMLLHAKSESVYTTQVLDVWLTQESRNELILEIVFEHIKFTLADDITLHKSLRQAYTELDLAYIIRDISSALLYAQYQGVLLTVLQPAHITVEENRYRLADFTSARESTGIGASADAFPLGELLLTVMSLRPSISIRNTADWELKRTVESYLRNLSYSPTLLTLIREAMRCAPKQRPCVEDLRLTALKVLQNGSFHNL